MSSSWRGRYSPSRGTTLRMRGAKRRVAATTSSGSTGAEIFREDLVSDSVSKKPTYFENYLPKTGHRYKIRILAQTSKTQRYFTDKGSGAVLVSANNSLDWQGSFLALGVWEVPALFTNILVKPTA